MRILAIETSCDDTGVAILEVKNNKFKVLSNIISSQEIHKNYGGVFPMMAKREHQNNLVSVLAKALNQVKLLKVKRGLENSKLKNIEKILEKENKLFLNLKTFLEKYKKPEVDLIAVTNGPGLEPCLWVGVNFAKALSYFWDIPTVPVNHIEAHILVNFIDLNSKFKNQNAKLQSKIKNLLPAICLVVSGGHTQLVFMEKIGDYKIIGETRDDAAGECFDKCAKILGLGYPGGPIISKIASQSVQRQSLGGLPRPMINSKDYDFSFSGLKTAVLYKVRDKKECPSSSNSSGHSALRASGSMRRDFVSEMCFEIQQAIIDVLIKKTINAARNYKVKTIILGGGVSANSELRSQFEMQNSKIKNQNDNSKFKIIYPPKNLSTDNALMIAITAFFHKNKKVQWQKLKAKANLRIGQ